MEGVNLWGSLGCHVLEARSMKRWLPSHLASMWHTGQAGVRRRTQILVGHEVAASESRAWPWVPMPFFTHICWRDCDMEQQIKITMKKGEKRKRQREAGYGKRKILCISSFHNTSCQFLNSHFIFVQDPTNYVADLTYVYYIHIYVTILRITNQRGPQILQEFL